MNVADAEEYTEALGQVVAGGYRQVALGERLGVPKALGMTTRDWVEQRLGGYVRLSISERREAVIELVEEGMTQREVADVLGVSVGLVNGDLQQTRSEVNGDESHGQQEPTSSDPVRSEVNGDAPGEAIGIGTPALTEAEREEAAERQLRWAATMNVLDGLAHFDREAVEEQAVLEAALIDPAVAASRGEAITADRLRRASAWAALLAEAIERTHDV